MKITKKDKKLIIIVSACFLIALIVIIILNVNIVKNKDYTHDISISDSERGKVSLYGDIHNNTKKTLLNVEIEIIISVEDSKGSRDEFIIFYDFPSIRENNSVDIRKTENIKIKNVYMPDMVADKIESVKLKFAGQDDYINISFSKRSLSTEILFMFLYIFLVISCFIVIGIVNAKSRLKNLSSSNKPTLLTESNIEIEKTSTKDNNKKCENCGATRGKNNNGKYCEYCGHKF